MRSSESKVSSANVHVHEQVNQPFFQKKGKDHFFLNSRQAQSNFFGSNSINAKLNIGQPNDKYEIEADATADKVVQRIATSEVSRKTEPVIQAKPLTSTVTPLVQAKDLNDDRDEKLQKKEEEELVRESPWEIQRKPIFESNDDASEEGSLLQRKCAACEIGAQIQQKEAVIRPEEKDLKVQSKPIFESSAETDEKPIQQKCAACENTDGFGFITPIQTNKEEEIQGKEEEEIQTSREGGELQMRAGTDAATSTPHLESTLNSSKGGGAPLTGNTKKEMESGFGTDFSHIRIHNDANAVKMNNQLGAQAFASGNNIYFNEGKFNPSSPSGKHLLAHELTHTVQQGASIRKKPEPIQKSEMIQTSLLSRLIPDSLKNNVRHIPGYTLVTVVLGYDPLTDVNIERNAINLIGGFMGLVPFGTAIFDKLQEYGIIDRVFNWVNGRLSELGLTVDALLQLVSDAWDESELSTFIDVVASKFNIVVARVRSFGTSLVDQIITWIKEALIHVAEPLLAENKAYALIKKIIKYDPLRGVEVTATTVEILEDFLKLIGKETELEQMREKGTLQETADWLDTQVVTFMSLLGTLNGLITDAWAAIQPSNLANIGVSLAALATRAGTFLERVWNFAAGVASKVLEFVKKSLLGWLSSEASSVRGYSLIKVIIGKDPFTGEVVPFTIPNVIRGFLSLMEGGEVQYAQMEETGVIGRIVGEIEAAVASLNMTPAYVIQLFTDLWHSFTINDLIQPLDAFQRIIGRFGEPIGRLIAFVAEIIRIVIVAILELMNFPFDLIGNIINRAMEAIEDIKRDPIGFLTNILRALKQGFVQFFENIVTHLVGGLTGWLMSELKDANLPPLTDFSLQSVISWVLEVLGISMEKIWEKLASHPRIGPERVAKIRSVINSLEGIWTFIKDVQERGMAAIWDKIQEQLSNLWNTVLDAVKNFVMKQIVNRITTKLLSMLDPSGIMAVINAVTALYNAIQSFIKYLREMLEVVNSFVNGVADIAKGNVITAANYLERTLGQAMPVVIGFLANQVGLTGIGERIGQLLESARTLVDEALTWLVNKAVDSGMALLDRVMGRSQPEDTAAPQENDNNFEVSSPTQMKTVAHTLKGVVQNGHLEFVLHSDPLVLEPTLIRILVEMPSNAPNRSILENVLSEVREIETDYSAYENEILRGVVANTFETKKAAKQAYILKRQAQISNKLQLAATLFNITELNDFFAAAPSLRFIPPKPTGIGKYIRQKLYDNMHSWSSFRDNYLKTNLPGKMKNIKDAMEKNDTAQWQIFKTEGLIEANAEINNYNPDAITYSVDHKTPVSSLWNESGIKSNDAERGKALLNTQNLRIMTLKQNIAKGSMNSEGNRDKYTKSVGPEFTSSIASGGANHAKDIEGERFRDADGQPIK